MEFRQEKARGVEEARFCRKMQNQLELKLIYMGRPWTERGPRHHLCCWPFWREHRGIVGKGSLRDGDFSSESTALGLLPKLPGGVLQAGASPSLQHRMETSAEMWR